MHNYFISHQHRPPNSHYLHLISKKKIDNNSPSAIMKREKNKKMKKNFEDLRNHAIKQATGRGPSMPALGGVLQPSLPDVLKKFTEN